MSAPGAAAKVAVLTGDFIGSTRHSAETLDTVFGHLGRGCEVLAQWHGRDPRLTRYRGDGWQALLWRPALALRSALFIRAFLLAAGAPLATRIAVGVGGLDRPGSDSLADADGAALRAAGRGLDEMPRGRQIDLRGASVRPAERAVFALADGAARRWSVAQGEALWRVLAPQAPTQTAIAAELGITQQSVFDRLDAAGFWTLREALELIEEDAAQGTAARPAEE